MKSLVFLEIENGKIKKSSLEAISYAKKSSSGQIISIVFGNISNYSDIGSAGATKILHVKDEKYTESNPLSYASAIAEIIEKENCELVILAKSSLTDSIAGMLSVKSNLCYATNVVALPIREEDNSFVLKTSIYTGKAFSYVKLIGDKKLISIRKNTLEILNESKEAIVEEFSPTIHEKDFKVKYTGKNKSSGKISLPEADIVVSAGRGLGGPENWKMIEDLAHLLGAATGCSKPVSDIGWRPHSEHVGQTGIKVSPSLYIAVGISGAIQHLAGVNSSRVIVVINKDPEAPFFKAADYGVVGDAFDVVPKLIEAIKKLNN